MVDTTFVNRCIATLEYAYKELEQQSDKNEPMHDILSAACVKEFELILAQSGKLLRKRLADYFASNREADRLKFKDLFRHACRHDLMSADAVRRWLNYRDHITEAAHEYGAEFADKTVTLLPVFIEDAKSLATTLESTESE